jgi:predicted cupin superfamily sugar epimerase
VLANRSDIASVHIVSHGAEGSLQLGASTINSDNLQAYSNSLQQWASALTADADILLYGCDVASGETGEAFVQQLSQLTGADVAASDDLTGSAALGGDWDLEVKNGAD